MSDSRRRYRGDMLPFEEARAFARSLHLSSSTAWQRYCFGDPEGRPPRPKNVPCQPRAVYRHAWRGWADWLGESYEPRWKGPRKYRRFEDARTCVHSLRLRSREEWRAFREGLLPELGEAPLDLPDKPDVSYMTQGWAGWADFLGPDAGRAPQAEEAEETLRLLLRHLPDSTVVELAIAYGVADAGEPREAIAASPQGSPRLLITELLFEDELRRLCASLGIGDRPTPEELTRSLIARYGLWRPFASARSFACRLDLRRRADWSRYWAEHPGDLPRLPPDIPRDPRLYPEFTSWQRWLRVPGSPRRADRWSFDMARAFVRNLGLRHTRQWHAYKRGELRDVLGLLPAGIPRDPRVAYRGDWQGMRDWLGSHQFVHAGFLPPKKARHAIRARGLHDLDAWRCYLRGRRGPHAFGVPVHPSESYAGWWKGWADWLGSGGVGRPSKRWRPFEKARTFARSLGLQSHAEWKDYCAGKRPDLPARPKDIPVTVYAAYGGPLWRGMADFLGAGRTDNRARHYSPLEQARAFARTLGLDSARAWQVWVREHLEEVPDGLLLPASPDRVYADFGWVSWPDFLGYAFRRFEDARHYVRTLGLRSKRQWRAYAHGKRPGCEPRPKDIPSQPENFYRERGWTSWPDFLGVPERLPFLPFDEARAVARTLGLRSRKEWLACCHGELPDRPRPPRLPVQPRAHYRGRGWTSWADFLGASYAPEATRAHPACRKWRPFEEARAFARSLGFVRSDDWKRFCTGRIDGCGERPFDIPSQPDKVYKNQGWRGFGDFLALPRPRSARGVWRPFEEARSFARSLGLDGAREWMRWATAGIPGKPPRPPDIPTHPERCYRDAGWQGVEDWLGAGSPLDLGRVAGLHTTEELVGWVETEVREGRLQPGAKLPGTKTLAARLGAPLCRVVAAFNRLRADGVVVGVQGKGTFVAPGDSASA